MDGVAAVGGAAEEAGALQAPSSPAHTPEGGSRRHRRHHHHHHRHHHHHHWHAAAAAPAPLPPAPLDDIEDMVRTCSVV